MLYKFIKRTFDIVASIMAIGVFLLPWLVISLIIKLQSPGPVIYKAVRVGLDGKKFTLYKFRTMCVDSGEIRATTLRTDTRVFSFGKFLRKSKLDETPQLLNILKGDMSVIGPRPEDEKNKDIFSGRYEKILSVRPGLSSPASLYDYTHGELCENEYEYTHKFLPQKLELELYYIEHRSCWYDLSIVVKTVVIIVAIMLGKKSFPYPKELLEICPEKTK